MALISAHFCSEVLGIQTTAQVLLPEADSGIGVSESVWDGKTDLPVLYLLHGSSDDSSIWIRRTSLDRYFAGRRMAIVIPECGKSMFVDQKYGFKYYTYITQELPEIMHKFFRISDRREDKYIAGLSMGGYGCMLAGIKNPELYSKVASMSGPLDLYEFPVFPEFKKVSEDKDYFNSLKDSDPYIYSLMYDLMLCYGTYEEWENSEWNIMGLLNKRNPKDLPGLRISITKDDMLYKTNQTFCKRLKEKNISFEYFEEPGIHEWAVWDRQIKLVLDWLCPISQTKFENALSRKINNEGAKK